MKLKTEIKKLDNKISKLNNEKEKFDEKMYSKIKTLKSKRFKMEMWLSHLHQLAQKRCKHLKSYGRTEWANRRDDASFSTYVACKKCDETLWNECYGPGGSY